ncbi:hypothetical protein BRCON_0661 [Candidatus Sumerlaea chitinivorans]|uniref:Uncharacterized protein n=1 Tax=Sumerlaea chitinivorans TaxID=2250252 RepID=A0A2Z4Y3H1_SUMC1|nr:hypothetical protein BRCON_0661 [Candidatus Sumerlaea chitinivorans]
MWSFTTLPAIANFSTRYVVEQGGAGSNFTNIRPTKCGS